jgi:hypothetical protein
MITFTSNDFVKAFSSLANASIQDDFGSAPHVVIERGMDAKKHERRSRSNLVCLC